MVLLKTYEKIVENNIDVEKAVDELAAYLRLTPEHRR
jgi:hypothetical protein